MEALPGAYSLLVAAVAAERVFELVLSRRNERRLLARGAVQAGAGHYPWMVALHTLFLAACVAEVWLLERSFHPWLGLAMLALVLLAMSLRYWVVSTLGERWTTRVYWLPGEARIESGPYGYLRHPNYLAVCVEMVALPLVHTAWLTAVVFSLANALLLRHRIRVEDAAIDELGEIGGRPGGGP